MTGHEALIKILCAFDPKTSFPTAERRRSPITMNWADSWVASSIKTSAGISLVTTARVS